MNFSHMNHNRPLGEEPEPMEIEAKIEFDTLASSMSALSRTDCVHDEENAAVESEATWVQHTVMKFPKELPTESPYMGGQMFYVRECYSLYYGMIIKKLRKVHNEAVMTVTGSPGIGKSLFFAYFFTRYKLENPRVTIITASRTRAVNGDTSRLEVAVWRGTKNIGRAEEESEILKLIREAEVQGATDGVLHLYDGSPRACPTGVKMVCFTSPNEKWFDEVKKLIFCSWLTMPPWDLKELQTAAEELNLVMRVPVAYESPRFDQAGKIFTEAHESKDVFKVADLLEQRYEIFGGMARECLSTDATFVEWRRQMIEDAISKLDTTEQIRSLFYSVEDEPTRQCICHYVPNPTNPFSKCTYAESTVFVKRLLVECLNKLVPDQRNLLVTCLRCCLEAASFRSTLFETGMHELLNSGHDFTARSLCSDVSKTIKFKCKKSTPSNKGDRYCLFDNDSSVSILSSGPYYVPSGKNLESIDSFYYHPSLLPSFFKTRPKILLFQMTVVQTHPVSGEGLQFVLERLGQLETVIKDPKQAALIFVVPPENAASFKHQDIKLKVSNDDDGVSNVRNNEGERVESLKLVGIRTIGDLRECLNNAKKSNTDEMTPIAKGLSIKSLRKMLATHDEKIKRPWVKHMLCSIPQYVWGAELDPHYTL